MTTPTEKPVTKRVADPELQAMSVMSDALGKLDDATRRRVLTYFADRYLPAQATQNGSGRPISTTAGH